MIDLIPVLIDSSAWIEYFFGTNKGLKVREIFSNQNYELFTPKIVISEVISKLTRTNFNPTKAFEAINNLSLPAKETNEIYFKAGQIHAEQFEKNKISMADSIIMAIAKENKYKILSFDKHFELNKLTI